MLFKNQKKTKVSYIINNHNIFNNLKHDVPLGLYKNLKFLETNNTGCPAVHSSNNRVLNLYSPIEMDLEIYDSDTTPQYKYNFNNKVHPLTNDMHDLVNSIIGVLKESNNLVHLQIMQPICFLTDDKELEITTVTPNVETKNLEYISGSYKPYNWIRNLNTTYKVIDLKKKAIIKLKVDKPIMTYVFNKPIDLSYVDMNEKIENYYNQNKRLIQYRYKLNDVYNDIFSRRPKKLLS
mgnify:FL=1